MIKPCFFFGLTIVIMLGSNAIALAQSLPVGTPVIEDAYRREQLLGEIDPNVSFMIRPIVPSVAFNSDNAFDPGRGMIADGLFSNKTIYSSPDGKTNLQVLPVNWQQQYNSHNPYGWNDGPMIPAAGYQSLFSAGVYGRYKFLSIRLQPELVYAQNKNFDGFTQARNDNTAWKAWYNLYNITDLPERFGTTPYVKLFPGQSSIRINFDPVSFGLSTENLWWGPGIRNSLVMSNNATGFAHLTLNTTRPIITPVGSFEFQAIAGKLTPSGYSPLVPGQPGNRDTLYKPKPNDWRYLSGLVFTYHPKWVPGLFFGLTRAFQVYNHDIGHGFADYLPIFLPFQKDNNYNANTGVDTQEAAKRDELASIFGRWLWPAANAEIYFEYGREDFSWNLRDLLLDPEHSRAYIVGFRKLMELNDQADEHLQVGVEVTQLAKPANDLLERNTTPDWYTNYQVAGGYTNNGQVLGAGIGPGGSLETLDISWVKGLEKIGLQIERYEHSADFYYQAFAAGEVRRHWVDYSAGLNRDWTYGHIVFSASLLYVWELNYQWKFIDNPGNFYFNQQWGDANNIKLTLNASYRF